MPTPTTAALVAVLAAAGVCGRKKKTGRNRTPIPHNPRLSSPTPNHPLSSPSPSTTTTATAYLARDALPLPLPCLHPVGDVDPSLYPSPSPLTGGWAPNTRLFDAAERLFDHLIDGAESVAVAPDGAYLLADKYGWVWEAKPAVKNANRTLSKIAHLGAGRPLGSHVSHDGRTLFVCLAGTGLVALDRPTRTVTLLASVDEGGVPILYANDLDVSPSDPATILFTDSVAFPPARNRAGFYDTMAAYVLSVLVGTPSGRLLRWDGKAKKASMVSTGLWFANGVAASSDGAYAAVVETNSMRVHRVELVGATAGARSVLIDRLPGFPDGITRGPPTTDGRDTFWIAIIAPAQPITALLPSRLGRAFFGWLPAAVKPRFRAWGAVARVSARGDVLDFLVDPTGARVSHTSAVTVAPSGDLLLGNLAGDYVSRVPAGALGR